MEVYVPTLAELQLLCQDLFSYLRSDQKIDFEDSETEINQITNGEYKVICLYQFGSRIYGCEVVNFSPTINIL